MLFYFPHYLWKTLEDRKLDKITNGLRGRTLSLDERKDQCETLVKYVRETFHLWNFYAFKYFICDILNFINVIAQMYTINAFLGGVFLAYGTDVLYWSEDDPEGRNDPMMEVFPRSVNNRSPPSSLLIPVLLYPETNLWVATQNGKNFSEWVSESPECMKCWR